MGKSCGLGGKSKCYKHTLHVALLDDKTPFLPDNKMNVVWRPTCKSVDFVTKFQARYGIIGRDVMREWKSVKISKMDSEHPLIEIEV